MCGSAADAQVGRLGNFEDPLDVVIVEHERLQTEPAPPSRFDLAASHAVDELVLRDRQQPPDWCVRDRR